MSVEALKAIAPLEISGPKKAVLMALAWHHGPTGCWPSWATLQTTTGQSRATIARALNELKALGYIVDRGKTYNGVTKWSLHPKPGAASVTAMDQPTQNLPRITTRRGRSHSETRGRVSERDPIPNLKTINTRECLKNKPGEPEKRLSDKMPMAQALAQYRTAQKTTLRTGTADPERNRPETPNQNAIQATAGSALNFGKLARTNYRQETGMLRP
jgi:DNA-binding transcriptional MocR family regulator